MKERIVIDPDLLFHLYIQEQKTCTEIARMWGCGTNCIMSKLKKAGIPIRTPSESRQLALANSDFRAKTSG